ncbi:MAG: thiamine-phosphate kinase [Pseudomonadales bacterium]|nr:thiamine-phosphate kinase [Pseudomonadales bacterium]NRA16052.1 thiamine-phosphate kinase [Oceanospirillaceae bacterium]
MDEFSLIERFFSQPNASAVQANSALQQGIGDDCAVLRVPQGKELVFSLDTLVAGVHFRPDADPGEIAWRLLGAAVSDLAAMGAEPNCFTLALTIPQLTEKWLQKFSQQLSLAAAKYQITLAGGDTTKGPLTLSVQVQGFVEQGQALLRSGAAEGDLICVTGSLGDSRAGLELLDVERANEAQRYLLQRYYRPVPRIATGLLLRNYASACIDISDGLLADLNHILQRSGVGAKLSADSIPMTDAMQQVAVANALQWALSGGEDFELCFTVPAIKWPALQQQLQQHQVAISTIGVITAVKELQIFRDGQWHTIAASGYNHFSND